MNKCNNNQRRQCKEKENFYKCAKCKMPCCSDHRVATYKNTVCFNCLDGMMVNFFRYTNEVEFTTLNTKKAK
ncbi:hypothetical protein KAR91_76745 [Candidatus Pacearchaeota archaeon]|nr:hypothetical protein [Candidatus Pacearchaeota archaeon]